MSSCVVPESIGAEREVNFELSLLSSEIVNSQQYIVLEFNYSYITTSRIG
jgi:hypothetical protein